MMQIPGLYVLTTTEKGRGVYAGIDIQKGDVIEVCNVIVIPTYERSIIHKTVLHDYYFEWGENLQECALALGYGSLYNHEIDANADFIIDIGSKTLIIEAARDIKAGQEITINYQGEIGDNTPMWWQERTG